MIRDINYNKNNHAKNIRYGYFIIIFQEKSTYIYYNRELYSRVNWTLNLDIKLEI